MNWTIGLIVITIVGCGLLVWYLYRRSKNETTENEAEPTDDGYEDLLLTGLMLEEIYDDDQDASNDTDADGYDDGFDGGYDDSSGLE